MSDKEKLAQWMIRSGYATGHGDSVEDLLQELDWQIAENWTRGMVNGVHAEREACAKVVEILIPEQTEWVGLTDEEIKEIVGPWGDTPIKGYTRKLFDQIEAKLKEKNHG